MNSEKYLEILDKVDPYKVNGKVQRIVGMVIESSGPAASIGELCFIDNRKKKKILAEVVGFKEDRIILMPLGEMRGITPGSFVVSSGKDFSLEVGKGLVGRVLNGLGQPIDGKGGLQECEERSIHSAPPEPLKRKRIVTPFHTRIKAIDTLLTCGQGQRMGIFSGSGVGKSVLLGMIARDSSADVNVIALIGERGREVREFIERDLREEGLRKTVVIAATSDQPPLVRVKAALVATTVAEYFRDSGMNVLLLMDSLTRIALAQREVSLAIGEPPTTRGFTPSVFSLLPQILERAGASDSGSITGFYTVLVEGDDFNEPISDCSRATLDGHIILSRKLAGLNHYPAIDVLDSVSRVMKDVASREQLELSDRLKNLLAAYKEAEDLINVGAYSAGSSPKVDYALSKMEKINAFLQQKIDEHSDFESSMNLLKEIFKE
ncbi:MAG: flagellar protein export ATPase FliI [candidate division Zixibacteria bacterium]|nr:flagellar protein export ATPase FliI [candidate division Zixibacteria bacterium]